MKRCLFLIILIIIFLFTNTGCFIYYKPEFKGQILDIDTKQPIEEVVVVAIYNKRLMGLGAGTVDSIINVKEALTDKSGQFHIPSYTTITNPFSWASDTKFIIFKPGYASLEMGLEDAFTGIAKETREVSWLWSTTTKFNIGGTGIIEMPKIERRELRLHAKRDADITADVRAEGIPLSNLKALINNLNVESFNLGLTPYTH